MTTVCDSFFTTFLMKRCLTETYCLVYDRCIFQNACVQLLIISRPSAFMKVAPAQSQQAKLKQLKAR